MGDIMSLVSHLSVTDKFRDCAVFVIAQSHRAQSSLAGEAHEFLSMDFARDIGRVELLTAVTSMKQRLPSAVLAVGSKRR